MIMELTHEQQKVVNHLKGHAIVSAVAGSGKTQTLVFRVKYLLEKGVNPKDILVVMYNKSAQLDFQKRLNEVIGSSRNTVEVKTFHSLGFALNRFLIQLKQLPNYQLITQSWQYRKLIQNTLEALKKEGRLSEDIDSELIDQYENYLTLIKSDIQLARFESDILDQFFINLTNRERRLLNIFFERYEALREKEKLRTFDDLIYEPIKHLTGLPDLISQIPWRYPYIIIDEYQDINAVQQQLIKLFVNDQTEMMVVGDVDQTIYEWRGSKPEYMLKGFSKVFGDVTHYQLSNTFRYGHRLSLAANYIITQNKQRLNNLCISHKLTPTTQVELAFDDSVNQLPELINNWLKGNPGKGYSDIAILVRKYSSAALFELACLKYKLPYQIIGNEGVTHHQVTLSLIGYLALIDQALFFDTLNLDERKKYLRAMLLCPSLYLKQNMIETVINQLVQSPKEGSKVLLRIASNYALKPFQAERIRARAFLWHELISTNGHTNAKTSLEKIIEHLDYESYFRSKQYGLSEAYDNNCICEAMVQYAGTVGLNVNDFLAHFARLKEKAASDEVHIDGVSILSIHRAKGLEWSKVIILDANERAFFGSGETSISQESERRLFYVAITRAKEMLLIIGGNDKLKLNQWYQSKRRGYPYGLSKSSSVRFLYEMNYHAVCEHLLDISSKSYKPRSKFSNLGRGKLFNDYVSLVST